jgi:hypothetical protein
MLDDPLSVFLPSFFYHAPNSLDELIPSDDAAKERVRVIRINNYRKDHVLRLVMDEEHSMAVAYLTPKQA